MKKHWIIVCRDKESLENDALAKECWGNLNRDIFTRRGIKVGDLIVFYLAKEGFKGIFEVIKGPVKKEDGDNSFGCDRCKSKIKIKKIKVWSLAKPINEDIIADLSFIKDKSDWRKSFWNRNLIEISADEYNLILRQPEIPPGIFPDEEALKDYIYYNWGEMNFGEPLTIFKDDEREGREYPAGTAGIIDFLCQDNNDNLVVLEFKKENKTSDETIGQISSYLGWVEKNIAKKNQKVRGIIITTGRFTDRIKYAANSNPKISLRMIKIIFEFKPV